MKYIKFYVIGFIFLITTTLTRADITNIQPAARDLATVCAQFPNQLPNQQCVLADDILANTHYQVVNNKHHPGNDETNYYLNSEYKRTNEGIVLSVHQAPSNTNYNCADPGESVRVCQYVSGAINSKGIWSTKGVQHGYLEIVATMPVADDNNVEYFRGMWPAFWMLPNDEASGWPTRGEIDILELHGINPLEALSTLHYGSVVGVTDYSDNTFSSNPFFYTVSQNNNYSHYHVFGLEWNFDADNPYLTTWYDGVPVVTRKLNVNGVAHKDLSIFKDIFQPAQLEGYYFILNIATGGSFGAVGSQTSDGSGVAGKPLIQMKINSIKSYKLQ